MLLLPRDRLIPRMITGEPRMPLRCIRGRRRERGGPSLLGYGCVEPLFRTPLQGRNCIVKRVGGAVKEKLDLARRPGWSPGFSRLKPGLQPDGGVPHGGPYPPAFHG